MTQIHRMSRNDIYPFVCFHYIHQNPLRAKLVKKMEDWEMSSFRDYAGHRNGKLINRHLAVELMDLPTDPNKFIEEAYQLNQSIKNTYHVRSFINHPMEKKKYHRFLGFPTAFGGGHIQPQKFK